ncbi:MAG: DUF2298 domain-containing protein [bacterium]
MPIKKTRKTEKKGFFEKILARPVYLWLGVIIFVALVLRLFQPDWYNDRSFHPDERWIVQSAVEKLHYPDKPEGLQYGSLPLYILSFYKDAVSAIGPTLKIDVGAAKIGGARAISGMVDTLTILFVFLLAAMLFGDKVGLFAALLVAFTPLHIHSSHFFTVDTFVTLFIVMTVYFSARLYKSGKLLDYIFAGVCYGAALASKTAALPAVAAIVTGHLLYYFAIKGTTKKSKEEKLQVWINLGIAAAVSFIAFFIFMPHAILDFSTFMNNQNEQRRILITGEADVPYNRQYLNTTPYLFFINNLVVYSMGIPYGAFAIFAFLFYAGLAVWNLKRGKAINKEMLIILAWAVPYFLIVGRSFGKFNRYMLPFTPFLAIMAAKLLYDMSIWIKNKRIVTAIKWIVAGGAIFYGLAFMNVYTNSHTWIQASRWFYKNVPTMKVDVMPPRQTKILNEAWGDDLPVSADGKSSGMYINSQWPDQEPDSQPWKLERLSNELASTDYVMMADKRAYGTYQRIPERYPLNYFYYTTMIHTPEKLGYSKAYEKAVYPKLFGLEIKDDKADESFQLYDHPHVYIFKNEKYLTKDAIQVLLTEGMKNTQAKFGVKKGYGNPNMGQLRDKIVALLPSMSVFFWYLAIQLLALIAMPLHFKIFTNFKDAGYGLSKATGIFIFAWVNWILVSVGLLKFHQANLWLLFVVLAALAGYWYWANKKTVNEYIKNNSKHIIKNELIFLAAYLFFIVIKLYAPDIHNISGQGYNGGGEPMGMAYLSSIFNDVKFPPHDPWMAGFTLNYYYWGQLIMATVSKMLGYMPQVTYNLSLAVLFALCFITAFSLVYNMTGKYKYGIFAGFLLAMAGNFHTLEMIYTYILESGNVANFFGRLTSFQFIWDPTRIYPSPVITEMPFFSYLYGDLHAHNIVIPFTVLLIAVLYNVVKTENKTSNVVLSFGKEPIGIGLTAIMVALLFGAMTAINTWNFPPMAVFIVMCMAVVGYMLHNGKKKKNTFENVKNMTGAFFDSAVVAVIILVAGYILFYAFHANFVSPYRTVVNFISKTERVSLYTMFKFFAVFFIVIFAYLWMKATVISDNLTKLKLGKFKIEKAHKYIGKMLDKIFDKPQTAVPVYMLLVGVVVFVTLLFIQTTFAILFVMIAGLFWVLLNTKDKDEAFAIAGVLVPLFIILGTELVFIADGRMNTVFKFYMVAWTFLAVSVPYLLYKVVGSMKKVFGREKFGAWIIAGVVVAFLAAAFAFRVIDNKTNYTLLQALLIITVIFAPLFLFIMKNKIGKYIFVGAFAFLLVPAVFYPLYGGFTKMAICSNGFTQKPRIDGIKYMENLAPRPGTKDFDAYDYQAINWINKNFTTIESILEAPGQQLYSGVSRISIFTGMPSFIGWEYQVGQQSGRNDEIQKRDNTANMAYSLPAAALAGFVKNEDISYLYVGNIERSIYSEQDKFDAVFPAVYQNEKVKLYKIK